MGIFDKFNNQGMGDREAFEELCCQLFETWGQRQMNYDSEWTYRNIRGAGGDGGIEAYWRNGVTEDCVGLQAKWFRSRLTHAQYDQIKKSIDTALELRPSLSLYIVCIPHDLTSMRKGRGKVARTGEDSDWDSFASKVKASHPALRLELWDEAAIGDHLQRPENEGRRRLWFDKTLINPDAISLALGKALTTLRNRYIPELADDGGLSVFLDSFYGTVESRTTLAADIETCIHVCREIDKVTRSFVAVGDRTPDTMLESARACQRTVDEYADALGGWSELVRYETHAICDMANINVDYAAIEDFESHIQDFKSRHRLYGHVDALLGLFGQFRELPSERELVKRMRETLSSSHALVIGDQGVGKTCGFASKAREYLDGKQHLSILIRATDINVADTWFDIISRALGLRGGWDETALWQALSSTAAINDLNEHQIAIKAKVAILIDGLDENPAGFRWPERIRCADAITMQYPRIRFAYSMRREVIDCCCNEDLMHCVYHVDGNGDVPAWKLFDRYIRRYNIDMNGHERYKWLLNTPMELSMFCLAYEGRRITDNVSTCMTGLVDAELNRLETEFEERHNPTLENFSTPVRRALFALAGAYLTAGEPLDRVGVGRVIEDGGVEKGIIGSLLSFLDDYGILYVSERPGKSKLAPKTVTYLPGTRHLWDYFMALRLVDEDGFAVSDLLSSHQDAAEMYGILLIERRGILPLACDELVGVLGEAGARALTFNALSESQPTSTEPFRQWALEEMSKGKDELFDVVNGVVVQVAGVPGHPLGPCLLDEYLRSFASPIDRDVVWAIPRNLEFGKWNAMYDERDVLKHLPKLHAEEGFDQTPLLVTWGLASVSNLRRRHCRNELVSWSLADPQEFSRLFSLFCDCDDPQVREDMYGIAAEIVCMGEVEQNVKAELASLVLRSIFEKPDIPGNRDAAVRYYGRLLIERCCADGVLDSDVVSLCRPPYTVYSDGPAMRVCPDACASERMSGYGPIHYDLARYVLVDELESAFGLSRYALREKPDNDDIDYVIELSADEAGCEISSFEGWAIAAAYQYLIDHGYNPDVLEGPINDDGCRKNGIDRKIRGVFDCADHGSMSTVMTVVEKYVWCARNEVFGYLADRVRADGQSWMDERHCGADGRCLDYGELLSFASPLFEATITELREERAGAVPTFPLPFSCDDGGVICLQDELDKWIDDVSPDAATALFGYKPNVDIALKGDVIPMSLFAGDWGLGGKGSRVWAYAGIVEPSVLVGLGSAGTVVLDGYDNASAFERSVAISASYISPVGIFSAPWLHEHDEGRDIAKSADVHVKAVPLAARGVDSLIDIGDYWYRYPSRLLTDLCGIVRTDGSRYYDACGNVIFEDISFGESYMREFRALLADRKILEYMLQEKGLQLVWYVTVQRESNSLARERILDFEKRVERSWIVWQGADGAYQACQISDECSEPERSFDPHEFLRDFLENRNSCP